MVMLQPHARREMARLKVPGSESKVGPATRPAAARQFFASFIIFLLFDFLALLLSTHTIVHICSNDVRLRIVTWPKTCRPQCPETTPLAHQPTFKSLG